MFHKNKQTTHEIKQTTHEIKQTAHIIFADGMFIAFLDNYHKNV